MRCRGTFLILVKIYSTTVLLCKVLTIVVIIMCNNSSNSNSNNKYSHKYYNSKWKRVCRVIATIMKVLCLLRMSRVVLIVAQVIIKIS